MDVFSRFNSLYPNSHYYIAGDGPDLSNLKNRVIDLGLSSSVTFLGHINQDLLFKYLQKSNFFLIMSYVDHLPNVIKEAMYQKCVVITSDTVGIDELIDNKKNGFILDIDDYMQSVDILIDLVNDKERYKSMVEYAHEVILEKFDIKKNVAKYIQSWEHAIKQ